MAVEPSELPLEIQQEKLNLAREFANANYEKFNDSFIESLEKDFKGYGYLTKKQMQSLQNIIDSWRMEGWAEREGVL